MYFGLYADIRAYLRLIEEGAEEPMIRAYAQQVIDDYVNEGRTWDISDVPSDVVQDVKQHINPMSGQIDAQT
jgi:hypothetical protein